MNIILSIYGISRMILGIAQLVGLTAGFFIVEWVIHYPKGAMSFVFDQDILAIVYLAVCLRAVFHLVAGIGIARTSEWVIGWLSFGWPIILIIVGGLIRTQMIHWIEIGLAKNIGEILSWPKFIVYILWVLADYFWAIPLIRQFNQSVDKVENNNLDLKKIGMILFAVTAFFVILLYLGKPIKQGFHQGYFRIKETAPEQVMDTAKINEDLSEIKKLLKEKEHQDSALLKKNEVINGELEEKEENPADVKKELPSNPNVPEDVPYRQTIGYIGALGIVIALILQVLVLYNRWDITDLIYSFLIQSVSFFLFLFYGMSNRLLPVAFLSFFALSLSVTIVVILWFLKKQKNT